MKTIVLILLAAMLAGCQLPDDLESKGHQGQQGMTGTISGNRCAGTHLTTPNCH